MAKDYGGPAFPTDLYYDEKRYGVTEGMSLRDWFAGQVLPQVYAGRIATGLDCLQESIAQECYELADAMLAERAKE